jgi:small-conductance mechanosensitive channel
MTIPADAATLAEACGPTPSAICRSTLDLTGSIGTAQAVDLLARPLKILLVVVLAVLVHRLVRRALRRFTSRLTSGPMAGLRAASRAKTISDVLGSVAAAIIGGVAFLTILGEIGINLGPLLAGAGVAGVAFGFGAQSLVKDFLSGLFMLIEDQYGVGDSVDVGTASGVVEAVTLRTTRLRDTDGVVWHIPNGEIRKVGNKSQQWGRATVDIDVASDADLERARDVIASAALALAQDDAWSARIVEDPEVWGVERLAPDIVTLRLVVKTVPGEPANVTREIRRRIKSALDAAGIPQRPPPARTS